MARAPTPDGLRLRAGLLKTVLIYAVFSALWILFSDLLVGWLFHDPAQIVLASSLKGWAFVIVTSFLLWGLLRRLMERDAPATSPVASWVPFLLLALAVVALTVGAIALSLSREEAKEGARLQAIADLKTSQIGDWLREREADARFIQTSTYFAEEFRLWQDHGDGVAGARLMESLGQLRHPSGHGALLLLDNSGRRLLGTADASSQSSPATLAAVRAASKDRQLHRVGPYIGLAGHARLDFVVPLAMAPGLPPVVVIQVNPAAWLFPMLQSWPVPSTSGETLLFWRDGDHVLFLNALRHRQGAAASLRVPAGTGDVLAAQVLRGEAKEGELLKGHDYRGAAVLGMVRAIPGTDWFLVTKLDRSELYQAALHEGVWTALAGTLALLGIAGALALLRQRQRLAQAETLGQAQQERLAALQLLAAVADASQDAIFAKDTEGRYTLFNSGAELITGKRREDILGRDDNAVFPAAEAAAVRATDRKILDTGESQTLEETLSTPSGASVVHVTKGALRSSAGAVVGVYGIARDVTESKRAQLVLLQQEALLNDMSATVHVGGWTFDPVTGEGSWTPELARIHDLPPDAPISVEAGINLCCEEYRDTLREAVRLAVQDAQPYDLELEITSALGRRKWVRTIGHPDTQDGKVVRVHGSLQDITDRKGAEAALRESEAKYRLLADNAMDWIFWVAPDESFRYVSPACATISGHDPEEFLADPGLMLRLIHPDDRAAYQAHLRHPREVGHDELEFRLVREGGGVVWIAHQCRPLFDQDGGFLGRRGTNRDISARKLAEEALRESEERFHAMSNQAAVGIVQASLEGRFLWANAKFCQMLGYDKPDMSGMHFAEVTHPDDREADRSRLRDLVENRVSSFSREKRYVKKDGRYCWGQVTVSLVHQSDGMPSYLVAVVEDIQERKEAEDALHARTAELQARNEELERFNEAAVGRELDMIGLKQVVNELSAQLGRKPPFALEFLADRPAEDRP